MRGVNRFQRRELISEKRKKKSCLTTEKMANLTIESIANSLEDYFQIENHRSVPKIYRNFHYGTHANTLITATLNSNTQ